MTSRETLEEFLRGDGKPTFWETSSPPHSDLFPIPRHFPSPSRRRISTSFLEREEEDQSCRRGRLTQADALYASRSSPGPPRTAAQRQRRGRSSRCSPGTENSWHTPNSFLNNTYMSPVHISSCCDYYLHFLPVGEQLPPRACEQRISSLSSQSSLPERRVRCSRCLPLSQPERAAAHPTIDGKGNVLSGPLHSLPLWGMESAVH